MANICPVFIDEWLPNVLHWTSGAILSRATTAKILNNFVWLNTKIMVNVLQYIESIEKIEL